MGTQVAAVDGFVQVAGGVAQRLPAQVFQREMDRRGSLFRVMSVYAEPVLKQVVQTAACNLHDSRGRCARSLYPTDRRARWAYDCPRLHLN